MNKATFFLIAKVIDEMTIPDLKDKIISIGDMLKFNLLYQINIL